MRDYDISRRKNSNIFIYHSLRTSSPGRSGGVVGKGRRACNFFSGIWIPRPISLWLPDDWAFRSPPISAKRKRARILTNIDKHVPREMTTLLMSPSPISISHWLFLCRSSNSRDVVASFRSFSRPTAGAPRRAYLQAIFFTEAKFTWHGLKIR